MDKSLDEIITTNKTARRARPRRASARKQQIIGTSAPVVAPAQRNRRVAPVAPATGTAQLAPQPSEKIIVSNLPTDVNEAQVKELFHTTVGPLRDVMLHYDSNGKSKGIATVHFQKKGDGSKAYSQYNNRLIDGKRPMRIEVVVDPARVVASTSLVSRVAPAPVATATAGDAPMEGVQRNSNRGRRGRGGGGGRPNNRAKRPPKSAADLDAEMEDYTSASAVPAVVASV